MVGSTGSTDADGVIFCHGSRANGQACREMLGANAGGTTVIRQQGRVITGVIFGITCGKCGTTWRPRFVREQLPPGLAAPDAA